MWTRLSKGCWGTSAPGGKGKSEGRKCGREGTGVRGHGNAPVSKCLVVVLSARSIQSPRFRQLATHLRRCNLL